MSKNPSTAASADATTRDRLDKQPQVPDDDDQQRPVQRHRAEPQRLALPEDRTRAPGRTRGGGAKAVLRNSDRNSSPSSARRPTTPMRVDGLSTRLAAMPATEGCWPVVVGIRKGSGVPAQIQTRHARPPMHTADEA